MSEILKKEKTTVALVGFPNSGKTTLYNWLTGSKSKTVNYPGSTVEYSLGTLLPQLSSKTQNTIQYIDTPGIYSFQPQTLDEEVTLKVLNSSDLLALDLVLLVIDGTQLARQLHLIKSLQNAKANFKIVLTMSDLLKINQIQYDLKMLKDLFGTDVVLFDGRLGQGLFDILKFSDVEKKPQQMSSFLSVDDQAWIKDIRNKIEGNNKLDILIESTLKIDRFMLHPFFGYVIFFAVMTLIFSSMFWFATPFMDGIDYVFSFFVDQTKILIPGLFGEFVADGVIAALGGITIFIPQIFILFSLIYILEASGYLARLAALIDRPMAALGLGGRSFVPMLSGFGCAIPAIIATRNITSKKEKFLAQILIPFLTCSARIPVFSLMIQFLFPKGSYFLAGMAMAGLYFASILIAALASAMLAQLIKSDQKSKLLMDLPLYRRPRFRIILRQGFDKSISFVKKAGPIIFVLSIIIWFSTNFPRQQINYSEGAVIAEMSASDIAQNSYAAQAGKMMEPIFKPMGFDWRVGFALISAFAAREVFVSALVLIFNTQGNDDQQIQNLLTQMREAHWPDGTPLFTLGSSIGLLLFFMVAMQCLATFAVLKKETGSFKIAIVQLIGSNLFAYVLAVSANYLFRFH